jgi:hypothetical protein
MLVIWFFQLFILNNVIYAQQPTCYRSSRYLVPQTPGDNGFRITVEGGLKVNFINHHLKNLFLLLYHQHGLMNNNIDRLDNLNYYHQQMQTMNRHKKLVSVKVIALVVLQMQIQIN